MRFLDRVAKPLRRVPSVCRVQTLRSFCDECCGGTNSAPVSTNSLVYTFARLQRRADPVRCGAHGATRSGLRRSDGYAGLSSAQLMASAAPKCRSESSISRAAFAISMVGDDLWQRPWPCRSVGNERL
jgi:hypothetical protein